MCLVRFEFMFHRFWTFLAPAFGLAAVALLPCADLRAQPGTWQQAIEAGDRALQSRDFDRAESQFQIAMSQAGGFGDADPRKAETFFRMARLYRAQGDFAKPENLYSQALTYARKALPQQDATYARYLNEIGRYYHTRRKYDRALEFYMEGFRIRVALFGQEHPDVAESIDNLAVLYENEARLPKAEVYYQTALQIREKALGPDHVDTITTLEHYARLLYKLQRGPEAEKHLERARAVRQQRVREAAASLADANLGEAAGAGAGVRPPEIVENSEPEYTEEARIARHEGTVLLQADVSATGEVKNVTLLRSLGLGLDERAVEAVKRWRFKPARRGRQEVAFRATFEVNFRLL
jgi:TonB family protein